MTVEELSDATHDLLDTVVGVIPHVHAGALVAGDGSPIAQVGGAEHGDQWLVYRWPQIGSLTLVVSPTTDVARIHRLADELMAAISRLLAGPSIAALRAAA